MLRSLCLVIVGLSALPALAQQATYNWYGKHACIVEQSVGVEAFPDSGERATFNWTGWNRSFLVDIRNCKDAPKDWEFECSGKRYSGWDAIKVSSSSRDAASPAPFEARIEGSPFVTAWGETFVTDERGRFVYSLSSRTADKELAVFVASGTCTRFNE